MIKASKPRADKLHTRRPSTVLYNMLLDCWRIGKFPYLSRLWWTAWNRSCRLLSGPVQTKIHGRKVIVNYGHVYPLASRSFRTFNNPLIELVFQTYSAKNGRITLVDVGANVGDTILLLDSNCPGMIEAFYCIEADPEFFAYLQHNLAGLQNGTLLLALLSSTNDMERTLVRTQTSSASARGGEKMDCVTLDSLLGNTGVQRVDVLKTDVEGLDGKVLVGARRILEAYQPAVIFEWHPLLCIKSSSNCIDHFDSLEHAGYETFVWFTKYGEFSHCTRHGERETIFMLQELCLRNRFHDDWHYDVIALPKNSPILPLHLAESAYARKRRSSH